MSSVVIADDHEVVRQGIRALLNTDPHFRIAGEARDGVEAVRVVERTKPDILLLDIVMPGLSGIEVIREALRVSANTRILVLSMHADESYVVQAFRNGASGYILKDARSQELLEAVRLVAGGQRYLSPPLSQRAIDAYLEKVESEGFDTYETLTPREREILHLAAEGFTNSDIGERLFISPRTVETHRAHLMRKLSLRTHTDLVLFAVRRGILRIE
jgi:DNA-binding NarL/FixJ family response regulator